MPRAPDTAATKRIKPDEVASDHRTAILPFDFSVSVLEYQFSSEQEFDAALLAVNAWILELVCRQHTRKYSFSDGRTADGTFLLARTP
jgi:hypothetical protein